MCTINGRWGAYTVRWRESRAPRRACGREGGAAIGALSSQHPQQAPRGTVGWGSDPVSIWLVSWKQLLTGPPGSFRRTVKNSGLGMVGREGLAGQESQKQMQALQPSSSSTKEATSWRQGLTHPKYGKKKQKILKRLKHSMN